jgi:hypothetical protein
MTKKKAVAKGLYGIAKAHSNGCFESFCCIHKSGPEAYAEAVRLAQKENMTFVVVQLVMAAVPGERPVESVKPEKLANLDIWKEKDDIPF